MQIKRFVSLIPFLIFCVIMISFFYNGFLYPIESDFWIVRFGIPILVFELCSIFVILFFLSITGEDKSFNWAIFLSTFVFPLFFCFAVSFFYNIFLFPYFLLSIFIKYLGFRKIKNFDDFPGLTITSLSLLFSMVIGGVFESYLSKSYPAQSEIIVDYIINNMPVEGDNTITGSFVVLFGFFYFSFQIIFTLIYEIFHNKKRKSAGDEI